MDEYNRSKDSKYDMIIGADLMSDIGIDLLFTEGKIRMGTSPDEYAQEKISCSLVLKLKVFISKYLQEHYTRCITRAVLFFKNIPGTFFNATHQVKPL